MAENDTGPFNPWVLTGIGVAGLYASSFVKDPKGKLITQTVSGAILGWGVVAAFRRFSFSGAGKVGEAVENAASVVGRAVGIEDPPGIYVTPTDDEGLTSRNLGTPKNVHRVVGQWTEPVNGGSFKLPLFADTFTARAVVRNDGKEPIRQQFKVRVEHSGLLQSGAQQSIQDGPWLELAPGQSYEVLAHLAGVRDWDGTIGLSLLFANFNLDKITVRRDFTLY